MKTHSHDTDLTVEDAGRNRVELTVSTTITPDDIYDMLYDLPSEHLNQIARRFTEDHRIIAFMLQEMSPEDRRKAIGEGLTDLEDYVNALRDLDQEDRNEVIGNFCRHCGSTDDPCWCQCDD